MKERRCLNAPHVQPACLRCRWQQQVDPCLGREVQPLQFSWSTIGICWGSCSVGAATADSAEETCCRRSWHQLLQQDHSILTVTASHHPLTPALQISHTSNCREFLYYPACTSPLYYTPSIPPGPTEVADQSNYTGSLVKIRGWINTPLLRSQPPQFIMTIESFKHCDYHLNLRGDKGALPSATQTLQQSSS